MFLHVCSAVNRSPFGYGALDFVEIWHDSLPRYATNLHQISYESNMPFVRTDSATDLRKLARNGVSLHIDCGSPDCGCSDIADFLTPVVYTHFYRENLSILVVENFQSPNDCGSPDCGSPIAGHPIAGHPIAGHPIAGHRLRVTRLRVTDCGSPDCGSPIAGHPIAGHPIAGHPIAGVRTLLIF
jgi:hypothetical protein